MLSLPVFGLCQILLLFTVQMWTGAAHRPLRSQLTPGNPTPLSSSVCGCTQDALADLFGAPAAAPAPAPAPAQTAFPPVTAFERDGVRAVLAFRKPPGTPAQTEVTATYTNDGAAPISNFTLQVTLGADPWPYIPAGLPVTLALCLVP